jgi:5-methylcytosine-specific restriction endonuclease McrA
VTYTRSGNVPKRLCLECLEWADPRSRSGSRCTGCERSRNARRNAQADRQGYKSRAYREIPLTECRRCGSLRNLNRHHKVPLSKGGTNDPSNIEILCASCHSVEHTGAR